MSSTPSNSRYRRFLCPMPELNGAMARHLTDSDHHDHEAMIALDEQGKEGIGVARYFRHADRPEAADVRRPPGQVMRSR
jgi:hypothetical protein